MMMGNMGYIQFNFVFDKGTQRGAMGPPCPRENSNTSDLDDI